MSLPSRRLDNGVPLGGIGAGKIEFCADGHIRIKEDLRLEHEGDRLTITARHE